jgi:hypothetical protein
MPEGVLVGIVVGLVLVGCVVLWPRCCRFYRNIVILGVVTKLYGTGSRGRGERRKGRSKNK